MEFQKTNFNEDGTTACTPSFLNNFQDFCLNNNNKIIDLSNNIGDLSNLNTINKDNLINAVNEVNKNVDVLNETINNLYKIGDLFLSTNSENPTVRFGGTWELFGKGRTLVCVDEDDSDFNIVKKTGGEKNHTLTVNEMPSHNHPLKYSDSDTGFGGNYLTAGKKSTYKTSATAIDNIGGGQPHNNVQPYITCYIWVRIS